MACKLPEIPQLKGVCASQPLCPPPPHKVSLEPSHSLPGSPKYQNHNSATRPNIFPPFQAFSGSQSRHRAWHPPLPASHPHPTRPENPRRTPRGQAKRPHWRSETSAGLLRAPERDGRLDESRG